MTPSDRDPRRKLAQACELSPMSLCGSYVVHEVDSLTSRHVEQGLVVAEPQPGIYLVEFYDLVTDEPTHQRLLTMKDLCATDDGTPLWRFFDSPSKVREALFR